MLINSLGEFMIDDYVWDTASHCERYKVGIMPTEDGDKVVLVFRADHEEQMIYWLDASSALDLAQALIVTACAIQDAGSDIPPAKN